MSPRLTAFGDEATWRHAQQQPPHGPRQPDRRQGRWLDLRFLAALGEPCYWVRDRQDRIQQDYAASRLEMQPRNIGSEFVGNRLRKLADASRRPHHRRSLRPARQTRPRRGRRRRGRQPHRDRPGRSRADRQRPGLVRTVGHLPASPRDARPSDQASPPRRSPPGTWAAGGKNSSTPRSGSLPGDPRGPGPSSPHPDCSPSQRRTGPHRPALPRDRRREAPSRCTPEAKSPPRSAGSPSAELDRRDPLPVQRFGSDNAPERRALTGQPITVREGTEASGPNHNPVAAFNQAPFIEAFTQSRWAVNRSSSPPSTRRPFIEAAAPGNVRLSRETSRRL